MATRRISLTAFPGRRPLDGLVLGILLLTGSLVAGCQTDLPLSGDETRTRTGNLGAPSGPPPPGGAVTVSVAGENLDFWPYTSAGLSTTPSDPINLVFVGAADPVAIRAALLALNGDRTAFGLPAAYPFNALWSDAFGDVQTAHASDSGWLGSIVQLQLGQYGPVRFHLRLFGTGVPFGDDGGWTLGAAHFEVLIPGTTDHQVLSWEIAQSIVTVDLIRSELLVPTGPIPTPVITSTPSFRDIPAVIYNGLPAELKTLIGGPPGPVASAVPLVNDGVATLLHMVGSTPLAAGDFPSTVELTFNQVVPRPFCAEGPADWLYVTGPVTLEKTAHVAVDGSYMYESGYHGRLHATPVDITVNPPVPVGGSFDAVVGGNQNGEVTGDSFLVNARDRRLALGPGGAEMLQTRLHVASEGRISFEATTRCLDAN